MRTLFCLFICSCVSGFALYFGNPSEPNMVDEGIFTPEDAFMAVKVGYQGDYVFDRRLRAYDGGHGRIDRFQTIMNQGVVTLDAFSRVGVYGSVGAMESYFDNRPKPGHARREFQTNSRITWGVGGRIILFEWDQTSLGVGGGFQWANPHIKWDALDGTAFTTDATMKYREWQVGLGVSHCIDIFVPYAAIKYSDVFAKISSLRHNLALPHSHFKMRNRDHFGIVLGCTLSPHRIFDMTVEVRLIDEQAVSLSGNIEL